MNRKEKLNSLNKYFSFQQKNKQEVEIENILASLIHMTINRSFKSKQRLQEMFIYDFLYKNFKFNYAKN